ncbi:stalk domain-containing protein [Tepidibacter hydrothermalis]|uniref:Stalk domain-containing protein n=1 Tax=Tepidibacter hydrothermalis TaxID=3036126 RepID=A0ABY8EA31_9FIRM|nr:stalk domain-containing protein [Tepidibacter hydrothermalis]WFD08669.1 stalk domain-containing protein [Tepidibacter hydrothermalis]
MKKILLISICVMLLFTGVIYAKDISEISLNGEVMTFPVEPINEKGTTLVPIRSIFEALGATVVWNSEDKSVSAIKGNINVWLQLDSSIAKINDEEITLAVAPRVVNGTTLVPIRFVTETFGGNVEWDAENKRIIITTSEIKKMTWPVPSCNRISAYFGRLYYEPRIKGKKIYSGIAIPAKEGSEIVASSDGKVMISEEVGGYGNVVFIDHGEGIVTIYAHCSELLVEEGSQVKEGDKIAKTGSCLHFEVRVHGKYVDPQKYVKPIEKSINEEYSLKIEDTKEKLNLLCQQISSESNSENIEQVLTNFRKSIEDKSIDAIYFAKETGGIYLEPYNELPDDYDARERTWYINTKKDGNYISDTYTDIISGNKIITITKGIYKNGKFIGVVGLDMVLEFGE